MSNNKKIEEYLGAYLAGEASAEAKEYVESWINEHPDHLRLFEKYKTIWNLKKGKQSNKENAFHELTRRIEQQQREDKHIKRNIVFLNSLRIAAGLLILAAAYFLIQYFVIKIHAPVTVELITKEVPHGKKSRLQLPDGSTVHLNSGSELEYPESFNTDQRKVSLTGEAFFEVVKSRKPFEVFINEHKIVVLGTSFNVKTNPETGTIETLVVTGNVTFTESNQNKQNNEIPISEGEKLHFDKTTRQIKKTSVDNYDDIAWKDGILVFKNDAMKDVFSDLEKWYGVSFSISNNQILQCNLTAKFDNESLQEVLDYIDVIMPLKYSFSENNEIILVQGKGCYDFQSSGNN